MEIDVSAEEVTLKVIVENSVKLGLKNILGAHGFSALVEVVDEKGVECRVLFDTGPNYSVLRNNCEVMGIDMNKIDAIVLSHGHYDHTGGLLELLNKLSRKVPVICHPDCFKPKFVSKPKIRYNGIPFALRDLENKAWIILSRDPLKIADSIITSGEIPRKTAFEKINRNMLTIVNGKLINDQLLDDQSLIINFKRGAIIITGCAHAGIVNTILRAQELLASSKIEAVIGGFHLISASNSRISETIEYFKNLNIKSIMPCHCTGEKAIHEMYLKMKDKVRTVHAGDVIKFA